MGGNLLHLGWLLFLFGISILFFVTDIKFIRFIGIFLSISISFLSISISISIEFIFFLVFIRNLHCLGLSHKNGMSDKFRIVIHHSLQSTKVSIVFGIILQMQYNFCTTSEGISALILTNGVSILSIFRGPNILCVRLGVLCGHGDTISDEEGRVESNSKHTNLRDFSSTIGKSIHEFTGTRICYSSKTTDQIILGHSNSGVGNGQSLSIEVVLNAHLQLRLID
mmetsp:Transcript_13566/g.20185  ORF Transcript_13566/g.20185 Transcript_13566/m.20185 type:complete len:224 (-) Transcript_13566:382-1053(-)